MAYHVERLETCLRMWEDYFFLLSAANMCLRGMHKRCPCSNTHAIVNAPHFRRKLLRAREKPVDVTDFLPPPDLNQGDWGIFHVPKLVSDWCFHSRRVYGIQEDLAAILLATSLEGVTWRDVAFPFPCYAISLEKPIVSAEGLSYDFMVFQRTIQADGITPRFGFSFFPRYGPYESFGKLNIEQRLRRQEWAHVLKLCIRYLEKLVSPFAGIFFDGLDVPVVQTAQQVYHQRETQPGLRGGMLGVSPEVWDPLLRIGVGMCLYLKTLPSASPHQSEWRPVPRSGLPDPRAISNEAQVCTVSSCYKLTTQERVMLGLEGTRQEKAQYELSCHFRQGHWRRRPGLGNDPTAQKTVHVRHCIVRRDRLREGELPGGSEATIASA